MLVADPSRIRLDCTGYNSVYNWATGRIHSQTYCEIDLRRFGAHHNPCRNWLRQHHFPRPLRKGDAFLADDHRLRWRFEERSALLLLDVLDRVGVRIVERIAEPAGKKHYLTLFENFAHIRHVPSIPTIQGPTGFCGVQAFMNKGHSVGLILPTITK